MSSIVCDPLYDFAQVNDFIYISSCDGASDITQVIKKKIKGVINVATHESDKNDYNKESNKSSYKKYNIMYYEPGVLVDEERNADNETSKKNFLNVMNSGAEKMFEWINKKGIFPILVHCVGGQNRSGSVISSYLINYQLMTFEESRELLLETNEERGATPVNNLVFQKWLTEYESSQIVMENRTRLYVLDNFVEGVNKALSFRPWTHEQFALCDVQLLDIISTYTLLVSTNSDRVMGFGYIYNLLTTRTLGPLTLNYFTTEFIDKLTALSRTNKEDGNKKLESFVSMI